MTDFYVGRDASVNVSFWLPDIDKCNLVDIVTRTVFETWTPEEQSKFCLEGGGVVNEAREPFISISDNGDNSCDSTSITLTDIINEYLEGYGGEGDADRIAGWLRKIADNLCSENKFSAEVVDQYASMTFAGHHAHHE